LVQKYNIRLNLRQYLQNAYEMRTKKHFVVMNVDTNLWMKSSRTRQLRSKNEV